MTDTATATTRFGPMTTTRDEPVTKGPEDTPPQEPEPEEEPERAREIVFELAGVEVRYSGVTAVEDVNLEIAANEISVHRALGLRQDDGAPLLESHARPHP